MGKIAEKRGVNVIKYGLIEDVDLPENYYDIVYFNGSKDQCTQRSWHRKVRLLPDARQESALYQ